MILDLVTNPLTMNDSNIAAGYDVFTGNVDQSFPDKPSGKWATAAH